MKKPLLIKSLLLLCALIVGNVAWADKITDYANIVSGTQYYIGATTGDTDYYLSVNGSSTSSSIAGTAITSKGSATIFTFAGSGTSWTIQFESGNYLSLSGSKDNGKVQVVANAATFTASNKSNKIRLTIGSYSIQKNNSGTQFGSYGNTQTDIWLEEATPAYSITAQSNNTNYGTVSLKGSVITGSPKSGYRYASPAYTINPANSATVAQDGNAFTVTPSANTTVTINFEAIPSHTATFSVNGTTTTEDFLEEAAITFPSNPSNIAGKTFVGWTSATIDGTTNEAPSFVTSATMGTSDITYYAVFALAEVSGDPVVAKTQTLQYDTWSYSGTTTNKNSYRLFGNGSYIESAAFDLSKLSKVIVYGGTFGGDSYNSLTIGDGTNAWKSVTVSGKSETGTNEFTGGTTLTGTKKLRITATAGDGSNNGIRISKVDIYTNELPITYSEYCTTVVVTAVETPEISPTSGLVASGQEVTITCTTEGASIRYTTDGTTPTSNSTVYDPTNKPTITANTTIKAIAVKDGLTDSEVASATYTIALPCATPTFSVEAGEVAKGTTVTISSTTENAIIYYTTDGTTPTANSLTYSNAITINSAMTIKAIAAKEGMLNSEVASVTYTLIDYATLPFSWDGTTTPTGVTNNGVETYNSSPYLKFGSTGDNIILKFKDAPNALTFDIKGNSFSGGTFKVQTSANGTDYTDLATYTSLGDTETKFFLLESSVRYIKWIYTTKSSGNVGLGNINLTETVPLTITTADYATFVTDQKVNFAGTGITAYTAKVNGNSVTLTSIEKVPANTPVVVYKDVAATTTFAVPVTTADIAAVSENDLCVSDGKNAVGDNVYVLGNTDGIGFYKWTSNNSLSAGKVYLNVPAMNAPAGSRDYLTFAFEDQATGVGASVMNSEKSKVNSDIFDLQGRRVVNPTKGLYIVNGKKVIVK